MMAYLWVRICTVTPDTPYAKKDFTYMIPATESRKTDTVWGTLPYTIEYFLPEFMELTLRLGTRYANRNNVDLDEAIAEARFHLVLYFTSKSFLVIGYDDIILRRMIYHGLIKYFQGSNKKRRATNRFNITWDVMQANMDEEMITWLSGYLGDEYSFRILKYLKEGLTLEELELLPGRKTKNHLIPDLVRDRLINLCKLGDQATRKVKRGGHIEEDLTI